MTPQDVLDFWFAPDTQARWFASTPAFDEVIRTRFGDLYAEAAAGALDWANAPKSALALIIVLDQFPRNMFRNTAKAFATDHLAFDVSRRAVDRGFDKGMSVSERQFLYMPFMHTEDLAAQDRGLGLYEALGDADILGFMKRHHAIIARFGRFPYRNAMLGRESTPEELASEEIRNPF